MDYILVKQHNNEYYIYYFDANNQKQLFHLYGNKDVAMQKARELCKLHNFELLTHLD